MKSKFVFGLVAVMVILALAPSSFAQVNVQLFNSASPMEVKTNRTAETSDPLSSGAGITVSGSLVAASNLSTTNLILTFPSVITVGAVSCTTPVGCAGQDVPSGDAIRIVAATGIFTAATIVTRNGASLTISLIGPVDIVGNTLSGSFRVVGTRIDANGLATPANGTASLSSSANNFILTSNTFPVIAATGDGIASIAQDVITAPNGGAITIFTNRTPVNANTSILITEGFNFAWRSAAQNQIDAPGAPGVGATEIRLTVNGIPSTVTLNINTSGTTSGFTLSNTSKPNLTSTNNVVVFTVGNSKPDAIDKLQVNLTATTPTSNPSIGSITATATMYPLGDALNANGTLVTTVTTGALGANDIHVVPRFVAAEVGPATIGNIIAASTTLLIPYAVKLAGFDTGIAIANTTLDPFGSNGGSATPTAGGLTLDFFPRAATGAGTPFSLATSATVRPGIGLSTDGTLAPGGLWSALLSEVLTAAGQTADFSGYIFIRTNFLLAHGAAFISDFRGFTSATPVNILTPPAFAARNVLIESLNQ